MGARRSSGEVRIAVGQARLKRAAVGVAWGSGVLLTQALAAAAELQLEEPSRCTSADELSFRVSRALGRSIERVPGPAFAIRVREDTSGFHARLELSAPSSQPARLRLLDASSCEELTDALALAIALALGSSGAAAPPADAAPTPRAAAPVAGEGESPISIASRAEPAPLHLALDAALVADTGTLPAAGLGAAVGVRLGGSLLELRAEGLLLPAREARLDAADARSPGAELGLLSGALLACVPLSPGARFGELAACAGAELGALSGTGTQVATPHERHALWSAARLDLGALWPLPALPLAVELRFTAAAPLLRDEFVLKDIGTVHRPANVVGRASLGLAWAYE